MRLFTAIPLPKQTKDLVAEMTRGRLPIPYINTTNLHITLNFFGELSDAEVDKVKNGFPRLTANQNGFEVQFESIKKFHNQIHLTVKPNPALLALQTTMQKSFEALGFRFQDREYYPHVKLGNLHMDNVMNAQRKLENFPNDELLKLSFKTDKIILYESKLLLHHPKYIPLLETDLV
jgi:2'-5' RNA ligase